VSGERAVPTWASCYTCRDYARERREAIAVPLANKARTQGRDVVEVVDEFMAAAHERHLTGEPLRPGGPVRVTNPTAGRLLATYALLGQMADPPTTQPHTPAGSTEESHE
jgi:hypothetical protein